MIFRITMKDPDGAYDSIRDEAQRSLEKLEELSDEELEILLDIRDSQMREFAGKWLESGEYITIEFDTEEGTAIVIED